MEQGEPTRRLDGEADAVSAPNDLETSESEAVAKASLKRSEDLLREGQELFDDGHFDRAIHVWTRIRFIEKDDARARAAIERAKRAQAERQRQLDQRLAEASRLHDEGDVDGCSAIVEEILSLDSRHAETRQLHAQLEASRRRPDAESEPLSATPPSPATESLPASVTTPPTGKRGLRLRVSRTDPSLGERPGSPLKMAGFVVGAMLVLSAGALYLSVNWESIVSDGAFARSQAAVSGALSVEAPVPDLSELSFFNGSRLYRKGRYRDALIELGHVERDSSVAESARRLTLRIEQLLLRGAQSPEASDAPRENAERAETPTLEISR